MDQLLKKVAEVLCTVYAPSHSCLYSLKRMGITGTKLHFRDRKKELTADDKKQIKTLLTQILAFDIDSENHSTFMSVTVTIFTLCFYPIMLTYLRTTTWDTLRSSSIMFTDTNTVTFNTLIMLSPMRTICIC
jgi:hypothetical protein